jgi:hypothetical protein
MPPQQKGNTVTKYFNASILQLVGFGMFLAVGLTDAPSDAKEDVALFFNRDVAAARFAAEEIRRELTATGRSCTTSRRDELPHAAAAVRIVLASTVEESQRLTRELGFAPLKNTSPQSYSLRKHSTGQRRTYIVLGADAAGAMYGGLDLAEAIRLGRLTDLQDQDYRPFIERRGIKFNIPLDARTPSYSDAGDSAQQNIPEMWNIEFWHEMLNDMARQRFNVLTLWNLHPFPSLVKVPEYPDVALDGVMRTTARFDSTYSLSGHDMVRKETLAHLVTLKKMPIQEKVRFWREVMQYAHNRGIEVYLFTWNIFTWGAEGKYGITGSQTNPTTIDYFRKSVRETFLTYPLLAGIGITAGENMQDRKDEFSKEKWLWKTYGEGIRDVKKLQPGRSIRLIHRFHQTSSQEILADWKDYPDTLDFSFKYAVAHMYSTPAPPFARQALTELPSGRRLWMTVRNDDIYSFRWGDSDFARAFVRNLPGPEKLAGYYMGPDGYIWGREFLSTEPEKPRQLVIQKQWYSFMLWGRLSYDPTLPDALFERTLAVRFPEVSALKLFRASSRASKIIPLVTRFYWNDIDLKWFPEACLSHPKFKGFHTVKHLMEGRPMPESGILSIRAYCDRRLEGQTMNGMTPLEVAAELQSHARATLQLVSEMGAVRNKELRLMLGDLRAMAHLGNYYAEKILGATDLAFFDRTGEAQHQQSAVKHLQVAVGHWKEYATAASAQYRPQLLTRIGQVDLNALAEKVRGDVEIADGWKPRLK